MNHLPPKIIDEVVSRVEMRFGKYEPSKVSGTQINKPEIDSVDCYVEYDGENVLKYTVNARDATAEWSPLFPGGNDLTAKDPAIQSAGTQLKNEVMNMVMRYGKESDVSVYESIGALEAVKADLLEMLVKHNAS